MDSCRMTGLCGADIVNERKSGVDQTLLRLHALDFWSDSVTLVLQKRELERVTDTRNMITRTDCDNIIAA